MALATESLNHAFAKDGFAVENMGRSCLRRTEELLSGWAFLLMLYTASIEVLLRGFALMHHHHVDQHH